MIRLIALIALILSSPAYAQSIKMAVTTSFHNSGLSDVLLPAIKRDTGLEVQLLVVGTGQALRLGQAGDVDAILVHSKQAEMDFVANGFAAHRTEIMYNDFVFIGPTADAAHVKGVVTAIGALQAIEATKAPFVSRGDDSGTHKKELALWAAADLQADALGAWYKSVGAGMGASLNTAAGMGAYILADRASWLNFGNKAGMALLFAGDPALFNQYAYLPINPQRHPHVNADAVKRLEAWLTSTTAETIINGYQIGGEALFVFNAKK